MAKAVLPRRQDRFIVIRSYMLLVQKSRQCGQSNARFFNKSVKARKTNRFLRVAQKRSHPGDTAAFGVRLLAACFGGAPSSCNSTRLVRRTGFCASRKNVLIPPLCHEKRGPGVLFFVAERGGFEPPDTFPHRTLSKRVPSTTQPPLRMSVIWLQTYVRACNSIIIPYHKQKIKRINANSCASRGFCCRRAQPQLY